MVVLGFFANYFALRRICRQEPDRTNTFSARLIQAITLSVILLLLMGFGAHNLYRCNWLWFSAFQMIAVKYLADNRNMHAENCQQPEHPVTQADTLVPQV